VAEDPSSEPTIKKCSLPSDSSLILLHIRKIGTGDYYGVAERVGVKPTNLDRSSN
jgi:hypothetical protein